MTHESLPAEVFTENDLSYLVAVENDLRPLPSIRQLATNLQVEDKDLYHLIDVMAYEHSGEDIELRELYFREFLLLSHAVRRINQQDCFPLEWAERPPILSI